MIAGFFAGRVGVTRHLGVIGCGTMGRAIISGLIAGSDGWEILATTGSAASARRLSDELPVSIAENNVDAATRSDVVVLAVKPQMVAELMTLPGMRDALDGKLLISICAGVRLAQLETYAPGARVIRAMPNTPALIREGMTVISRGEGATEDDVELASRMFESVGRCRELAEKHLDAVTGLSGSGPAFACVMLEALADGGVMMGLPRDVAVELAAQTMQGAARLVLETGEHPAALRDSVTTPAGCTIAGLFRMEEGRIRSTLARTVQVAAEVASGLGGPKN